MKVSAQTRQPSQPIWRSNQEIRTVRQRMVVMDLPKHVVQGCTRLKPHFQDVRLNQNVFLVFTSKC
jgi:hypothetical protein